MKLGVLVSHPIQYHAPLYRELARRLNLKVFFAHRQTPNQQAAAGYGVAFEWDSDLLSCFDHKFLVNRSRRPSVEHFSGCDTPDIGEHIRNECFDAFLVLGWYLKCHWQAIVACRQAKVPIMVRGDSQLTTSRTLVVRKAKGLIYPKILRCFDAALYVGARNREYLRYYHYPEERHFRSPHCVDNEMFTRSALRADRTAVRASWGVGVEDRVILFVGRLVDFKRVGDLIGALAMLGSADRIIRAVIVGDGSLRECLAAQARSLAVPVLFLGFRNQSQLPEIYAAADALVLPSTGAETWGLVVNEALACGTPAVVSDACGCGPDLITPGQTGEVYVTGDVSALASAIERCLQITRGSAAISSRSREYSVSAAADGIETAMRWLLTKQNDRHQ